MQMSTGDGGALSDARSNSALAANVLAAFTVVVGCSSATNTSGTGARRSDKVASFPPQRYGNERLIAPRPLYARARLELDGKPPDDLTQTLQPHLAVRTEVAAFHQAACSHPLVRVPAVEDEHAECANAL